MERTRFLPSFSSDRHGNLADARRFLEMLRPFHWGCHSFALK